MNLDTEEELWRKAVIADLKMLDRKARNQSIINCVMSGLMLLVIIYVVIK